MSKETKIMLNQHKKKKWLRFFFSFFYILFLYGTVGWEFEINKWSKIGFKMYYVLLVLFMITVKWECKKKIRLEMGRGSNFVIIVF